MGKNNNIIIINGKRYDARTGAALGNPSLDGVVKQLHKAGKPVVTDLSKRAHGVPVTLITKPTMNDITRKPAKHTAKHQPQSSKTLMRHVVKKPEASLKRGLKVQTHAHSLTPQQSAIAIPTKRSISYFDPARMQFAKKVGKSSYISRFGVSKVTTKPHHQTIAQPAIVKQRPQPALTSAKKAITSNDILQHALANAKSHEQTYTPPTGHKTSSKIFGLATGSVIMFAVIAYGASQGLNSVRLHIASSKAGFAASVPAYKPAGYSLNKLSYDPGIVGLRFTSNSDDRSFLINEKASQWDSNTLRDMIVAPAGQDFQTVESAGRTIYIDNQQNANWVNGGIWYQVKAANALSNKQLVEIANSL